MAKDQESQPERAGQYNNYHLATLVQLITLKFTDVENMYRRCRQAPIGDQSSGVISLLYFKMTVNICSKLNIFSYTG